MSNKSTGNILQETLLNNSSSVSRLSSQSLNYSKPNRRVRVLSPSHSHEPENSHVEEIFISETGGDSPVPLLSSPQFFGTKHPAHILVDLYGAFKDTAHLSGSSNLHTATTPSAESSHFQRVQVHSGSFEHMRRFNADNPDAARELFEALRLREKYMLQMCAHMHKTATRYLAKYRGHLSLPLPVFQKNVNPTPRPLDPSRRKKSLQELPIHPPPHSSHPYEFDPKSLPPALEDGTLFCRMERGVFTLFRRVRKPFSLSMTTDERARTQPVSDLNGRKGADCIPPTADAQAQSQSYSSMSGAPDLPSSSGLPSALSNPASTDTDSDIDPSRREPTTSTTRAARYSVAERPSSASSCSTATVCAEAQAEAEAEAEWLEERVSGPGVSAQEFLADAARVTRMVSDAALKTFAFRRLSFLQSRFQLHLLLNEELEVSEQKRVRHRDFYNIRKVHVCSPAL